MQKVRGMENDISTKEVTKKNLIKENSRNTDHNNNGFQRRIDNQ